MQVAVEHMPVSSLVVGKKIATYCLVFTLIAID